jgi:hypothetical protein
VPAGERITREFGIPNLVRFPIVPDLSAAGDGGRPLVVEAPTSDTAQAFLELGAAVVREVSPLSLVLVLPFFILLHGPGFPGAVLPHEPLPPCTHPALPHQPTLLTPSLTLHLTPFLPGRQVAKLRVSPKSAVRYDRELRALVVKLPNSPEGEGEFLLDPAVVRRNDTSAASINEWTGQRTLRDEDVSDDIEPEGIQPVGNYAVQIQWPDGFSQVAAFELLESLPRLQPGEPRPGAAAAPDGNAGGGEGGGGQTAAQRILLGAQVRS